MRRFSMGVGITALFCVLGAGSNEALADSLSRPVSAVLSLDGEHVWIGNQKSSNLTRVRCEDWSLSQLAGPWEDLADIARLPASDSLLVVSQSPPTLTKLDNPFAAEPQQARLLLPGIPGRIVVTADGKFACISLIWKQSVCIVPLDGDKPLEASQLRIVPVGFPVREMVVLNEDYVLAADAFGGELAAVHLTQDKTIHHRIVGHHIAGMSMDASQGTVSIAHQRLSSVAQTNTDDIHWGNLIQNVITSIPLEQLLNSKEGESPKWKMVSLDEPGQGAGDPAGLATWDGNALVCLSGTDRVGFKVAGARRLHTIDVGSRPTRLVQLDENRWLCLNSLDHTADVLELQGQTMSRSVRIGESPAARSNAEQGEMAYYSSKLSHEGWMSCNSCHVEGHSPDLRVDTFGDEHFGSPKRIPSLHHVSNTGPWAWNGSKKTLEQQIEATLEGTMHRVPKDSELNNRTAAAYLAEYLQQQPFQSEESGAVVDQSQPQNLSEIHQRGQKIFAERGCARCHDPEKHFTSERVYDVHVVDEQGATEFNPPTLLGLSQRRSFFHDGRFRSIAAVLQNHPEENMAWNKQELEGLIDYLRML